MKYLLGLLLGVLLGSCGQRQEQEAPSRVIPVRVWEVAAATDEEGQNYSGVVEETFSSSLSFEVSGTIETLRADEGQRVGKGQVLACLDPGNLKSMHDAAASKRSQAEDAYGRYRSLHEKGSLPEIKWVEVENALQEAKSLEQIARKNLDNATLRAPFAGVIAQKMADVGTTVLPGAPVFKLVKIDVVDVKAAIPENEIAGVSKGEKARIRVAALGNRQYEGLISEKGVVAHPLSHTYDVKVRLANGDGALMPGMVCSVDLLSADDSLRIVIPHDAVQVDNRGAHFVWLAQNGKAMRRVIETGGLAATGIVVRSGLAAGEQLIVAGHQKVSEGMSVKIVP